MRLFNVAAVFLIAILSGCATFQGQVLPEVKSFPQPVQKSNVSVSLTFRQYINQAPIAGSKDSEKILNNKCIWRFNKSGLFGAVSNNNNNADISALIEMKDEGTVNYFQAFLTG